MERLEQCSREDLLAIDEVGEIIAESIAAYFDDVDNRKIIARLKAAGLQFELSTDQQQQGTEKLIGKTIVVSGVFTKFSRDQLKELIELNGGKNSGSISGKTSFLLAGDNMGPEKLKKAQNLGVPIISEEDFEKMIS